MKRKTNRKVGAENRVEHRVRAAMREHLGPDQKHRQTCRVLRLLYLAGVQDQDPRSRGLFDTKREIGRSTWHARVAIPAPQIRRRLLESG